MAHNQQAIFVIMPGQPHPGHSELRSLLQTWGLDHGISVHLPQFDAVDPRFNINAAINDMKSADLVVADLSYERPSCYFELGIAEAIGREGECRCAEGNRHSSDVISGPSVLLRELGYSPHRHLVAMATRHHSKLGDFLATRVVDKQLRPKWVNSRRPARFTDTTEVPQQAEGIAAARRTVGQCHEPTSIVAAQAFDVPESGCRGPQTSSAMPTPADALPSAPAPA